MGVLSDKVAVITGGASGMGLATVERYVSEGAKVVIIDLPVDAHDDLVRRLGEAKAAVHYKNRVAGGPSDGFAIAKRLGKNALFAPCDVTVPEQLSAAIDKAVETFGGLDIMFNNAGVGGSEGGIMDCSDELFDRIIDIDLKAVWRGIKLAAPHMIRRGGGSIISTSSGAGLRGIPGLSAYSSAKGGVQALTRCAAIELASNNIRVNCIAPGGIVTPVIYQSPVLNANMDPELLRQMLAVAHPIPRAGEPEDIAGTALWLASDDSSFVSGQTIAVDGALTVELDSRLRSQIVTAGGSLPSFS